MNAHFLLSFLNEQGLIRQEQATDLMEESERMGKPIEQIVANFGIIAEDKLLELIADRLGLQFVDLSNAEFTPELLSTIPPQTARIHGALPVAFSKQGVTVALKDPLDSQSIDDLRWAINRDIQVVVAPIAQIDQLLAQYYGTEQDSMDELLSQLAGEAQKVSETSLDDQSAASSAPIIKFVNTIIAKAIQAQASDIHFEPFEKEFKIRYRVDGALYEMAPPPKRLALPVISRIKVMSGLNIAERRIPQDGRIQTSMAGRQVDLRVSTLPTQHGESVVLRVLDRSVINLDLESLGMPDYLLNYVVQTIEKPHGIFIVTGPTGSGKTTTLYSCIKKINTIDTKILTAEDPVEYELEGIQQIQVNEAIGLTFARALRAFLRQDPDRILVGETRDLETAQIAIQSSLTGHLVLTSLHTNDAPGAITRLIDMGVEPFLISATLEGVLGQRLIRRICSKCRTPYEPTESVLAQIGLSAHDVGDKSFYYGGGCDYCNQTGYKGRKGIYELLDIKEPIRQLITAKAPTVVIRQKAIELGMTTLRQDGLRCIFDGETTIEEVLKYT
ncbi:MAG: GspE/PulE family protein [Verrucomicrobiales bacterium]|jgi:type IV pilus assembly protein PilB|nr:GspE/PulE family protein [Verrucomicrobiales bacterium]